MYRIYITEPEAIDIQLVRRHLKGELFELVAGDTAFSGQEAAECQVLLIRSATKIGQDIKNHFPHLKAVIRAGTGLDNVDVESCKRQGIGVFNAPGANAEAVADYVITMVLYALRNVYLLNREAVIAWDRFKFNGRDIAAQTVGIIGFGNIGRILQRKLVGLGCTKFLVYDPYLDQNMAMPEGAMLVGLERVLKESTIVSFHVPLMPDTTHLLGGHNMGMLQHGAILVNASRGGIVDEDALLAVMDAKGLIYIADTVVGEPRVNPMLLENQRVIITPHIASLTAESQEKMVTNALDNFLIHTGTPIVHP